MSVSYHKKQALENISLNISAGKTTAIIGKNGSGKSSLLRSLAGLAPYKGEVFLDARPLKSYPSKEKARKMAFLPQQSSLFVDRTVFDLVALGRFPHQKPLQQSLTMKERELIDSVLKDLNLWDLKNERVSSLSGGQRQRAWIGIVLAQESELLLLDEPTTYLDLSAQLKILKLLKSEVEKKGKTLVYVLHDLNQVSEFADELIILKDGQLFQSGATEDLFTESMIREVFSLEVSLGQESFSSKKMIRGMRSV